MRVTAQVDETSAIRAAKYQLTRRRMKAALEKMRDLKSVKSDAEFRRKAEAIIDEGLDESFSEMDMRPVKAKGFAFVAFLKKNGQRAGHGGSLDVALADAESRIPRIVGSVDCEVLHFTNAKGREVWETKISLADARQIIDGRPIPHISDTGVSILKLCARKNGAEIGRGPGKTVRWLLDEKYLIKKNGVYFTTDAGREALRENSVKV